MLTISAELSSLSKEQRAALCGFIQSFPLVDSLGMTIETERRAPVADEELTPEQAFSVSAAVAAAPEVAALFSPQATATGLDKSGLPWDERIHSSSKNFTADGNWRKKRGVDDALIAEVEGQLRRLMSIPSPAAAVPTPPVAVGVPPPPAASLPLEVENGREAYLNFIKVVSKGLQDQKITQAEVEACCKKYGVESIPLLAKRMDLIPQVAMDVAALIVSR